uniref:Lsr2 family protein n=1 Tax=Neobacillus citreus TaxID=2833578 RepID=A0A942YAP0_9BACI
MAQKVTVQLVDDLDDSPITPGEGRTVEFAFDGSSYEIDLTDDNVDKFREAISDYIAAARKVTGRRTGGSGTSQKSSPKRGNSEELAKIREWAKDNGYEVSSRGRISTQVQEAYAAAH